MASSFEEEEVSQKSSWTTSLCAQFPWLVSSSGISIIPSQSNDFQEEAIEVKLHEIRTCLDDGDDDTVNLWHLRELALTKGGLVSHSIRKRAWPKLMGAHEQVLLHAAHSNNPSTEATLVEITQHDLKLLEQDVAQPTIWNIEDHVWRNRFHEKEKQVTFALPGLTSLSPTGSLVAVHKATQEEEEEEGATSPMTATTPHSDMYASTTAVPSLLSHPLLPRSPQEECVLKNTILGLLRTSPSEDVCEENDRHYYYRGLQDITSLLLINLESPSLTCLLFKKLATYSLRDALRGNPNVVLQRTVTHVSNELLEKVDPFLFQHVQDIMWDMESHNVISQSILQWIPSWFVSHIQTESLASRLVDVFLVSHATMPMYVLYS